MITINQNKAFSIWTKPYRFEKTWEFSRGAELTMLEDENRKIEIFFVRLPKGPACFFYNGKVNESDEVFDWNIRQMQNERCFYMGFKIDMMQSITDCFREFGWSEYYEFVGAEIARHD
jgi:hypothetical protein